MRNGNVSELRNCLLQTSIFDLNFRNYHLMIESNLNLRKLCEKAILIKCILTLDFDSLMCRTLPTIESL